MNYSSKITIEIRVCYYKTSRPTKNIHIKRGALYSFEGVDLVGYVFYCNTCNTRRCVYNIRTHTFSSPYTIYHRL
jgi:hypothetical protein